MCFRKSSQAKTHNNENWKYFDILDFFVDDGQHAELNSFWRRIELMMAVHYVHLYILLLVLLYSFYFRAEYRMEKQQKSKIESTLARLNWKNVISFHMMK